jgi:hypothetical protein
MQSTTIGGLIPGVTGFFANQEIESVWAGGISCLSDWQVSGFGVNRAQPGIARFFPLLIEPPPS